MKATLEQILSSALEALGRDKQYWKSVKNRRLPDAVKVKQFVAYLGYEIEGYPMTRIGAFLGLSHATISGHYHNAKFFLQHEQDYREAMENALEIIDRLKGALKQVTIRGWVARDEDGRLVYFLHNRHPKRMHDDREGVGGYWGGNWFEALPKESFPHITWEDEPQECEITIKLR